MVKRAAAPVGVSLNPMIFGSIDSVVFVVTVTVLAIYGYHSS